MIFLNDGYKKLFIYNVKETIITNLVFIQLPWAEQTRNIPIYYYNVADLDSTINITSFSIVCDPASDLAPNFVAIINFGTATISDMSIAGCHAQRSSLVYPRFLSIRCGKDLSINGLSVRDIKHDISIMANFIDIEKIQSVKLSNIEISNVVTNATILGIANYCVAEVCDCTFEQSPAASVEVTNWKITNSQLFSLSRMISFNYDSYHNFLGLFITNLIIEDTYFNSSTGISFPLPQTKWRTLQENLRSITIQNCRFTGNTLDDRSSIILFNLKSDSTIPSVETIHMKISNFDFSNNSLSGHSSVLLSIGLATSITNLNADSNTFVNSYFLRQQGFIGSFFLRDSIVKSLRLFEEAVFLGFDLDTIQLNPTFELSYRNQDKGLFAQTRPFIIYNCNFRGIHISSSSSFITQVNPMIIYQQNRAVEISFNGSNSEFINFGSFPNYLAKSDVRFVNLSEAIVYLEEYLVYPFADAEAYLFQDDSSAYSIYNSARSHLYSDDNKNTVFFIAVHDNIFDSVEMSSQSNILKVLHFQSPNSSVTVLNNTFTNITSNANVNFISVGYLSLVFVVNQKVSETNSLGHFFAYISTSIDHLVLQENSITNSQKLGFSNLEAEMCSQILIEKIEATAVQTQKTFINIACEFAVGQISMKDSTFKDIVETSDPEAIESLSFISYVIRKPTENGIFYIFENNTFSNITMKNQQGFSKGRNQNSFLLVSSPRSSIEFGNNQFDLITMNSRGSIFEFYIPSISFSNSSFRRLWHFSINGAINAVFESLTIKGCEFDTIIGSDSIGVFKFTNPDLNNVILSINIQESNFTNNSAPVTTLISLKNSKVIFLMNDTRIISNKVLKDAGTLFYLSNLQASNIFVSNCNFTQNDMDTTITKSQISSFEFYQSQGNVQLEIHNSTLKVTEKINGNFILIEEAHYTDSVLVSALNYSIDSSFSLFEGENVKAAFHYLRVRQSQLDQNGIITINCNPRISTTYACGLEVLESQFEDLALNRPIITINSQSSTWVNALDNLTISVQNSTFHNITWNEGDSTSSEIRQGIISSTTSLVGRSPGETTFAVSIKNCRISQLQGSHGLLYNGIETKFDLVLLLYHNTMSSIDATGPEGIIHASKSELVTFESQLLPNNSRNASFLFRSNTFSNISAQTVLYWTSHLRGISIVSENNTFSDITSPQGSGGIFSVKYIPPDAAALTQANLEYLVILNSTFDNYTRITARKGTVIYAEGMNKLMRFILQNSTFNSIESKSTGGVITIDSGIYTNPTAFSYSSTSRRVLSHDAPAAIANTKRTLESASTQMGTIVLFGNDFTNISAQNGGVLFENTPVGTLEIIAKGNNFIEVTVSSRGGVFFLNQQNVTIEDNIVIKTCANRTGSFIYSVAGQINTAQINQTNNISDPFAECELYSFGPTNLKIEVVPLSNNPSSLYHYEESNSTIPYPVISNLTSYSLKEDYEIIFTLIYQYEGDATSNYSEIVFDETLEPKLSLKFSSKMGNDQTDDSATCKNSICTASPTSITLRGSAGGLVTVNATYQSDIYTISQLFYIQLRGCIPGEIRNTESGECLLCQSGSYSLDPNDSECRDCPIGATCNGGSSISVKPGYYRSTASSPILIIVPCNDSDKNCLGGDYQTNCSEAYSGIVCSQCNVKGDYLSTGKSGACNQCYEKTKLITFAVLLLIVSVLYQALMVVITYNENKNIHSQYLIEKTQKNIPQQSALKADSGEGGEHLQETIFEEKKQMGLKPGAFIVIFTTFSQICSVLSNFDVGTASTLISISVSVADSNTQAVFSLQCLYMLVSSDLFAGLKFETYVYVLSPIVKIALVAIAELLRNLICIMKNHRLQGGSEHEREETRGGTTQSSNGQAAVSPSSLRNRSLIRIGAVAVVLFLLEQPGIIASLCQYLTCTQLDPYLLKYYIKSRNNIECYTEEYNSFLYSMIIPALIFWAFVVPLAIFLVLYSKRKKLFKSEALRVVLGNFYNAYSAETYYWGIVIIIFKMSIFILDSVLTSSLMGKGVFFVMIIHAYFFLFKAKPPYTHHSLNLAEKYCCLSYMVVLTLVFLRMSIESTFVNKFCDVLIMIFMIGAGGYVLMNVFWLYILKVLKIIESLKERNRTKKALTETLQLLKIYHENVQKSKLMNRPENAGTSLEPRPKRRNAILVYIPMRLRNGMVPCSRGVAVKFSKFKKKPRTSKNKKARDAQADISLEKTNSISIVSGRHKKNIIPQNDSSNIKNQAEVIDLEGLGTGINSSRTLIG